jgi:hypothetical protein
MKTKLKFLLVFALAGSMKMCAVTYQGEFGNYTATPGGLLIQPHYAK